MEREAETENELEEFREENKRLRDIIAQFIQRQISCRSSMATNHSRRTRLTTAPRSQSGHYFRGSYSQMWGRLMPALGFGFLIVWLFVSAPLAITVADTIQAPNTTQSLPQPAPVVEDPIDLLNLLD
jgi:hypothetical protein